MEVDKKAERGKPFDEINEILKQRRLWFMDEISELEFIIIEIIMVF